MAGEVYVKGLSELQKFLDQLPPKVEANIMRGALRAGMGVVKPVAQSKIHQISGQLAAALKVGTNRRGGVVKAFLRAKGFQGYIGMWVEFGTRPHLISVQEAEKRINISRSRKLGEVIRESMTTINRRVLHIGNLFVGAVVEHPGASRHPFLRPALDAQAQNAVVAAAQYIKNRLTTKEGLDASHVMIDGDE